MGDRGQIKVVNENNKAVYLYTHWRGGDMQTIVKRALARRQRWHDAPYLTRIIFCELIKGQEAEETGFGISATDFQEDENPPITVNVKTQKVGNVSFENYIKD